MSGGIPVLLITANVGSIFEEPGVMLKIWTEEFLSTVSRLDPKFIALHCQEVGGKNYEQSMRHVEDFVRLLMSSEELRLFDKVRVYLDEDFSSAEHFTALGNFYFVHESLKDVLLWDFKECTFVPVTGKEVHSGNIEAVSTKEKSKFPQDFFPECKWSRKGFLRTRWSVSGTVFDLINIHLFHDASNFVAMETFPSVYSKTRRRALEHTLDRFHNDQYANAPYFLFGDFNFRTDTAGVIKKLTEDTHESKLSSKGNISRLQFRNKDENLILTLGKKEFSHHEHGHVFAENGGQWLREYDKELEDFDGRLIELPITFVPSYPFEEDVEQGTSYMQTRVPAWCDRVLLSPAAQKLVQNITSSDAVEYGIIGPTTCMGDHKPVYLRAMLASDAGMINCCALKESSDYCFRVPDHYVDLLSMMPDCRSFASARTLSVERSSKLLHAAPIEHDPYTPDSMDSPSPNAIITSGYGDAQETIVALDNTSDTSSRRCPNRSKRIDAAVSPALLKSRLELIARIKSEDSESTMDPESRSTECRLHTWPDKDDDEREWDVRKTRCNSDVSWQRSHLLTHSWMENKTRQGYRSFAYPLHRSSSDSSPADPGELQTDLVIPRIAIINPSNFESNESSVNMQEDGRLGAFSREGSMTRCNEATSGEGSSLDTSDDTRNELQKPGDQQPMSSRTQDSGLDVGEDGSSRGETSSTPPLDHEENEHQDCIKEPIDLGTETIRDEPSHLKRGDSQRAVGNSGQGPYLTDSAETSTKTEDWPEREFAVDIVVKEKMGLETETIHEESSLPEGKDSKHAVSSSRRYLKDGAETSTKSIDPPDRPIAVDIVVKQTIDPETETIHEESSLLERRDSKRAVGNAGCGRYLTDRAETSTKTNDVELLEFDGGVKDTPLTKKLTVSDSELSQDTCCATRPGRENIKTKACRASRRYGRDIVRKNGTRCTRCCCAIS